MSTMIHDEAILEMMKRQAISGFKTRLTKLMVKIAREKVESFVEECCKDLKATIDMRNDPMAWATAITVHLNLPNGVITKSSEDIGVKNGKV